MLSFSNILLFSLSLSLSLTHTHTLSNETAGGGFTSGHDCIKYSIDEGSSYSIQTGGCNLLINLFFNSLLSPVYFSLSLTLSPPSRSFTLSLFQFYSCSFVFIVSIRP